MHLRIFSWLLVALVFSLLPLRAQTAAPLNAGQGKFERTGEVKVARVAGKVTQRFDGVEKELKANDLVPQKATVVTAPDASIVLAFSNGATTQLGGDSELVIDEFLQDPFAETVKVAELTEEPAPSRTRLSLNRGELVGNVKKLKYERGSSFTVQTPVGAAGIRGTTFRIVFRPSGTGQAFFTLSTASGIVGFETIGSGGGGATQTPAPGTPNPQPTDAPTNPTLATPTVTGSGTAALPVPQGQEISLVVTVTQNAQGQLVVSVPPPAPTSTANISATNLQAVIQVAAEIAVAVQQTVFSAPPAAPAGTSGTSTTPSDGATPAPTTTTISGQSFEGTVQSTPPVTTQPTQAIPRGQQPTTQP
jgi:hypothetical protein